MLNFFIGLVFVLFIGHYVHQFASPMWSNSIMAVVGFLLGMIMAELDKYD